MQTQIRRRVLRRLIRVSTICKQNSHFSLGICKSRCWTYQKFFKYIVWESLFSLQWVNFEKTRTCETVHFRIAIRFLFGFFNWRRRYNSALQTLSQPVVIITVKTKSISRTLIIPMKNRQSSIYNQANFWNQKYTHQHQFTLLILTLVMLNKFRGNAHF